MALKIIGTGVYSPTYKVWGPYIAGIQKETQRDWRPRSRVPLASAPCVKFGDGYHHAVEAMVVNMGDQFTFVNGTMSMCAIFVELSLNK